MFSRVALASSRSLLRRPVATAVSRAIPSINFNNSSFQSSSINNSQMNFYTTSSKREESKSEIPSDVDTTSTLQKYGLDDWKIAAPVGLALGIPFVWNEWYIMNEETQLVACFMAFCGAMYNAVNPAVASYFDEQQESILKELQKSEELQIKLLKEKISMKQVELTLVDDIAFLNTATDEAAKKLEESCYLQLRHSYRDRYAKWLDAIVSTEKTAKKEEIDVFIEATSAGVIESFKTDAKLKKAALEQAIAILKDPKKSQPNLVSAQFATVGKKVFEEQAKQATSPPTKGQTAGFKKLINEYKEKADSLGAADYDTLVRIYYAAFKQGVYQAVHK
jgi:hypothetical protein